jgi:hypothetical protein
MFCSKFMQEQLHSIGCMSERFKFFGWYFEHLTPEGRLPQIFNGGGCKTNKTDTFYFFSFSNDFFKVVPFALADWRKLGEEKSFSYIRLLCSRFH